MTAPALANNESFITIQIKSVYGRPTCYAVDSTAKRFAAIAGSKTLTQTTLIQILGLCYAIALADGQGNISTIFRANDLHRLCAAIAA